MRTLQTKGLRTKQSETPHPSSVTKLHEMSSDSGHLWLHLPVGAQTSKDDGSKSHTAGFSNWRRKDFGAGLHPGPATLQLSGKVGDGPDGSSSW